MLKVHTTILALSLGSLAACGSDSVPSKPPADLATSKSSQTLQAFADCSALRENFTRSLSQEVLSGFWAGRPCWGCTGVVPEPGAPPRIAQPRGDESLDGQPVPSPAAAPSREVNQTNTQEQGVDEADLMEISADGRTLILLHSRGAHAPAIEIFDIANLDQPQRLSRLDLDNNRAYWGLYWLEDQQRLIVLSNGYHFGPVPFAAQSTPAPSALSRVQSFDVSSLTAPNEIGRWESSADLMSSRVIGEQLHVVTRFAPPLPLALRDDQTFQDLVYTDYAQALWDQDVAAQERLAQQIEGRIAEAVSAADISELLPLNQGQTLACTAVYAPEINQQLGFIQVSSMDSDLAQSQDMALLNNAWQLYASANNLYIAQTSAGWWFDPQQRQQTAIHRVQLQSSGPPLYTGSNVIDGWAANRYQFSEHAGHLRVATTLQGPALLAEELPSTRSLNQLVVLKLNDIDASQDLALVGQTPRFAPNEDIRAARFLGDKGYVVTFEFTDPLFAFDLSTPSQPRIAAELKIPGFSTYIHPLGPDHLLTLGREGGPDGLGTGPGYQLQIFATAGAFDDNPDTGLEQLATWEPALLNGDYAFSQAENEPLAFAFLGDSSRGDGTRGLLSIPAQIASVDQSRAFSGFSTFVIDALSPSIDPLLDLDHRPPSGDAGEGCPPGRSPPGFIEFGCFDFAPTVYAEPLRSKIVWERGAEDTRVFFTFSDHQLRVDSPDRNPTAMARIEIREESEAN